MRPVVDNTKQCGKSLQSTVIVAAIQQKFKRQNAYTHDRNFEAGGICFRKKDSVVLLWANLEHIDKQRLKEKVKHSNQEVMEKKPRTESFRKLV